LNLARGEKIFKVVIASKAFGEINPGYMGLQQLELAAKVAHSEQMEAEMKISTDKGAMLYKFSDLNEAGLRRVYTVLKSYARAMNQPGIFREYNFADCRDDEEMRFRYLLIPEYRAVTALSGKKTVTLSDVKQALKCPVCRREIRPTQQQCSQCGAYSYKGGGRRYFESQRASYFPRGENGEQDPKMHLCKVDFINVQSKYLCTHVTCVAELPIYLGCVYTVTPPVKPVNFHVVLNKPEGVDVSSSILPSIYDTRYINSQDLELLRTHDAKMFCGSDTVPYLHVSFPVWDYTSLEEVGSHVNYILGRYNRYIEQEESTG